MDSPLPTEQPYSNGESAGMAVVVACAMLSLISVLGMFIILGMSVVRNRRSPNETHFVRTQAAMYFLSLLICNLIQAVGSLSIIAWIVERRVYSGTICTAQGILKQTGSVGIAIFTFIIAVHNFSLLFLHCQWSYRTAYIVLIGSWAALALDMCIGIFALTKPEKGPYYGIAGYWCWIAPTYSIERLLAEYLFMFLSAGSSFILYLLVFFKLRGNITVSSGYKLQFHHSPEYRISRTDDGAYVVTNDRSLASHLDGVARHMLMHPIAYILMVLPLAATRLSAFSGTSVPFPFIVFSASAFVLAGFINTVLYCTSRNILPGGWREKFGIRTVLGRGRGDTSSPSHSSTRRDTKYRARMGGIKAVGGSVTTVEKDIASEHEESTPRPSAAHSLTWPPRAYDGKYRAERGGYNTRYFAFSRPLPERESVRAQPAGNNEDGDVSEEVHSISDTSESYATILRHAAPPSRETGGSTYQAALGAESPTFDYPFDMAPQMNTELRRGQPSSLVTVELALNQTRAARVNGGSGGNRSSTD